MNNTDAKYTQYALSREMLETAEVIRKFDPSRVAAIADKITKAGRLMLTGEGSSRIFPAKNAIRKARTWGLDLQIATEGSRQAATYDLRNSAIFAASNSGRTNEIIKLMQKLKEQANPNRFGLTANEGTLLAEYCTDTIVLTCGWEQAVAATKSVAEQALVYQAIVSRAAGNEITKTNLSAAADKTAAAMSMNIPADIVEAVANAGTIYFAGFNDGVAEELTLKTNEITRKKSDFLEGTYAVHGIEEVMNADDVVIVVEPIAEEMDKFKKVLVDGVGLKLVAIAAAPVAGVPTIAVGETGELTPYLYLAAGWNLLVETGLLLSINLDKPTRARKVGNEFRG